MLRRTVEGRRSSSLPEKGQRRIDVEPGAQVHGNNSEVLTAGHRTNWAVETSLYIKKKLPVRDQERRTSSKKSTHNLVDTTNAQCARVSVSRSIQMTRTHSGENNANVLYTLSRRTGSLPLMVLT